MRVLAKLLSFRLFGRSQAADLVPGNLALRQPLAVMQRSPKRPRLRRRDRAFWVVLSRVWRSWPSALMIVKPDTVIRWHRKGFKLYWRWRSRKRRPGRPPVNPEVRALIRRRGEANPLWGAPHIQGELLKLGVEVSERAISNLIPRQKPKPPSPTWLTFLRNRRGTMASADFLTVTTATFRILFVFVVLNHERRRVLHLDVTEPPSAEWTARQIVQAFPWDTAPHHLLRDRDSIYGEVFGRRAKGMGIREVLISRQGPWQNPFAERLIVSLPRQCLHHIIVLGEEHLRRILSEYIDYYHQDRTHYSPGKDTPFHRPVEARPTSDAHPVGRPRLSALHHRYAWREAA